MDTHFNFNSAICTSRVQSERLLSLGLKKETADMGIYYSELYGVDRVFTNDIFDEKPTFDSDEIPAWSLHRIMSMVYSSRAKKNGLGLAIIGYKNPFEDMIRQIEWLIKEGYFNKEYLV